MKANSVRKVFFTILILLSIFQRVITKYFSLFSYYDELLTLGMLGLYVSILFKKGSLRNKDYRIWILIYFIIICGLVGNQISGYERSASLILNGIFVWFKSFIIYICANEYFDKHSRCTNQIIVLLAKATRIIICLAFIMLVLSPVTHIGVDTLAIRVRYGFHPFQFVYSKAAILSWYCIAFALILSLDNAIENEKKNFKYLILLSIIWIATLRSRAFVFVLCYWALYFLLFKLNRRNIPKIKLRYVVSVGVLALLGASSAIRKYFFSGTTSRSILLITGIDIAKRFFPFGAGFANYATSASYKVYSSLYYYYGFNHIYRLKEVTDGLTELTDCYWPAVMGELGIIGLILISIIIWKIGKNLIKRSKSNKWLFMTTLFLIATSLFSSVATNVFSSDAMVVYIMIICIGIHLVINQEESEN